MCKRAVISYQIFVFALFLLNINYLNGQTPQNILIQHASTSNTRSSSPDCTTQDAGTSSVSFTYQSYSTDISSDLSDTTFLCKGDSIRLLNIGPNFSGDFNTATTPGVGYAFYNCPPTVSGSILSSVLLDPCILNNPPPSGGIWVFGQPANMPENGSEVTFANRGQLQTFFNSGDPVLIWFAPITYDFHNGIQPVFENANNSCVNVNINNSFPVVFLNEITSTAPVVNNCTVNMTVSGGMPEFDGSIYNFVDIRKIVAGNPTTIIGTVTSGSLTHNGNLTFVVPEPGTYRITIEDGKGCPLVTTATVTEVCLQQTVALNVPDITANIGSNVCIPVQVSDFTGVNSVQFTMNWDPTIIQFTGVSDLFFPDMSITNFGTSMVNNGQITFSWFDSDFSGESIPNGNAFFNLCFNVIGSLGEVSPVTFYENPPMPFPDIEISDPTGVILNYITSNGSITVGVSDLVLSSCSTISNTGAITIQMNSGTAPYAYIWQHSSGVPNGNGVITALQNGTDVINNLVSGNYLITVTDANNIQYTGNISVANNGPLFVTPIGTPPSCFNSSDGIFEINPATGIGGGQAPYSIKWSNGQQNVFTINNLTQGTYSVTVTDALGCTVSASNSIGVNPITLPAGNIVKVNASCSGVADGSITITPTGGTPIQPTNGYNFAWSNVLNGSTIYSQTNTTSSLLDNIESGKYYVTITDDNNCAHIDSITINAAKSLRLTAQGFDPICYGDANGIINYNLRTIGGQASLPYNISWAPAPSMINQTSDSTAIATNLTNGTYCIYVNDAAGCTVDTCIILQNPDSIKITLVAQTNVTCTSPNIGAIQIMAEGGTVAGPYDYLWAPNNAVTQNISNLTSGTYTVTVTDDRTCTNSLSVILNEPVKPQIDSISIINSLDCYNSNNGQLRVYVTQGGAAISSYLWSGGQNTQLASGVSSGNNIVTVTDAAGCTDIDTLNLIAPAALAISNDTIINPICPGNTNGRILLTMMGGTEPLTYNWGGGNVLIVPEYTQLGAGNYSVTITDINNCPSVVKNYTLVDPPAIVLATQNISGVTCFGTSCDGSATALASGGTAGTGLYNFTWENSVTATGVASSTNTTLCQGYQNVTITDGICANIDSVLIPNPEPFEIVSTITPTRCFGESNGVITVNANGGIPGYTFVWSNTQTGNTANNLAADVYIVTLTDAAMCTFVQNFTVTEPDPLVATIDPNTTENISCNGAGDGAIEIFVVGGNTGQRTYTWSGNVGNTEIATNLTPGTYTVTVTDALGCTDIVQHTITEPSRIRPIIPQPAEPLCFGLETQIVIDTVTGGVGPIYVYSVNGAPTQSVENPTTVTAGEYVITIEDGDGCTVDTTITITQPPQITIIFPENPVQIQLGESVELKPQVISVFGIDTVFWSPLERLTIDNANILRPTVSPIATTTYNIVVTDNNGCIGESSVLVDVDKNRNVYIPNAFSPNGDGQNDYFGPLTAVGVKNIEYMKVFDRWGNLLYSLDNFAPPGDNLAFGWDGSFNGKKMNPGVFVYIISVTFEDNITLLYRGDITLMY
ncbi:MAG: gliding motility-associated C-terminal domain-containing protein [Saprospiraceae bacterium]|nr:gliding motility-associated C-terminal domain-containing protein [Saprospiraceae bacterium]